MSDLGLEEVLAEIAEDRACVGGCGMNVVPKGAWAKSSPEERQEMREDGYVYERGRGYCDPCARALGARPSATAAGGGAALAAAIIREQRRNVFNGMRREGKTREQIAEHLGISIRALEHNVTRWKRDGQEVVQRVDRG